MTLKEKSTTHFGFQTIPTHEKAQRVGSVFQSVAHRYDLMNDLMSAGLHRLWKRCAISKTALKPGQSVLDLAGGTGDLARLLAKKVGKTGSVILADINQTMLMQGRTRLNDEGLIEPIQYALANAEILPFKPHSFDCITMGFGLRNVTHPDKALTELFRVLKPGGRLVVLEFSRPVHSTLNTVYDAFSFSVLPFLGKLVCNDGASYQYLAESIRKHPDQETLKKMMETAGFERTEYQNLSGGIVAIHMGFKF